MMPSDTGKGFGPVTLLRGQYAVECGGVLVDPTSNEVCLMFYPDTSEWRLPIGKPDAMAPENCSNPNPNYQPLEPSTTGCEPYAHAAQRKISSITGYACNHLHPSVLAHTSENPCAYMGPQMVEPLALEIDQRTVDSANVQPFSPIPTASEPIIPRVSKSESGAATAYTSNTATASVNGTEAAEREIEFNASSDFAMELGKFTNTTFSELYSPSNLEGNLLLNDSYISENTPLANQLRPSTTTQFVITYYYLSWLTQSRFEQRSTSCPAGAVNESAIATAPVLTLDGGVRPGSSSSNIPFASQRKAPIAEVTWFRMDTAVQVLTHPADKKVLKEAIQRLGRYGAPEPPFAYSTVLLSQAHEHPITRTGSSKEQTLASANVTVPSIQTDAEDKSKAESVTVDRIQSHSSRNLDLIRRTANTLTKRNGLIRTKPRSISQSVATSSTKKNEYPSDTKYNTVRAKSESASKPPQIPKGNGQDQDQEQNVDVHVKEIIGKKIQVPRVFSLFYKFIGSQA